METVIEKYNELHEGKRKVDLVKSKVMEFLEDVEEARYFSELAKADMDLGKTSIMMDPENEQRNAECDSELEVNPTYNGHP